MSEVRASDNGWPEYRKLVLAAVKELKALQTEVTDLRVAVEVIKVKVVTIAVTVSTILSVVLGEVLRYLLS